MPHHGGREHPASLADRAHDKSRDAGPRQPPESVPTQRSLCSLPAPQLEPGQGVGGLVSQPRAPDSAGLVALAARSFGTRLVLVAPADRSPATRSTGAQLVIPPALLLVGYRCYECVSRTPGIDAEGVTSSRNRSDGKRHRIGRGALLGTCSHSKSLGRTDDRCPGAGPYSSSPRRPRHWRSARGRAVARIWSVHRTRQRSRTLGSRNPSGQPGRCSDHG